MSVLEGLEPRQVFSLFEELCAIPHGSGHTKAVSDWCVDFARSRGLEVAQDALGNVIIVKGPAPGYETAEPVIVQGHLDMVCERAPGCHKDMGREGLELAVEGDTIYARGTTLGGDDGIAVAMALAILDDPKLPHPRVEAVFTVDEEVGMLGAQALDVRGLRGRRMLNIDSEAEGVFTVGCAGGNRSSCILPVTRAPYTGTVLRFTVDGLLGGHSGNEIHRGRGNSNLLMGRLLRAVGSRTAFRLIDVRGGEKDNAIPTRTEALAAVADASAARAACGELSAALGREYRSADPGVRVAAEPAESELAALDEASTGRVCCLLACLPDGVQVMSPEMPGLVQTSLNLGILTTRIDAVTASFCVRSSLESQKAMLTDRLRCLTGQLGGHVEVAGDYPGWEYRPDSPLRTLMSEVFREQYGREAKIEAIHAGVECGLFAAKLPGLDCVSFGPDLTEIHTCRERMHIASVQRTWKLLTEVLRRMK